MSIFVDCTEENFLKNYWQQKPLVFHAAITDLIGVVDSGDLAGIACEDESEARIIKGAGLNNKWSCEQGPFTEQQLLTMPKKNWTLLVQGVDQWIEDVNAILERFRFLPSWRLEDIMASYAPIGGGVGPHFDYYDVFLLQVSGTREWKLGQSCTDKSALQENSQVKLLEEFNVEETINVDAGDILYVPAGVAHWGTAITDECITLSVGFRAPSQKELLLSTLEGLIEDIDENTNNNLRYKDTVSSDDTHTIDSNPFKINTAVTNHLFKLAQQLTQEKIQQAMNKSFGELVTQPRHMPPLDDEELANFEGITVETINGYIGSNSGLEIQHPVHSRFAFSENTLFVNGITFVVRECFAKELCEGLLLTKIIEVEKDVLLALLASADIELDVDMMNSEKTF